MKELLHIKKNGNYLSPEIFQRYFELFYAKVNNFDKPDIEHLLWTNAPEMKFQFSTAARNFRLIDDKGAQSIIVLYNESSNLVEWLKRKGPESWLMRKLQRFVVSLNARDFGVIAKAGWIEQIHGCWIQTNAWLYNNKAGLMYADEWIDEIIIA